jgi:hypothetical protein
MKCLFANSKALIICIAFTFHIHLICSKFSKSKVQALSSITLLTFLESLNTSSHLIPDHKIVATSSQLSNFSGPYLSIFSLGFIIIKQKTKYLYT